MRTVLGSAAVLGAPRTMRTGAGSSQERLRTASFGSHTEGGLHAMRACMPSLNAELPHFI